MYVSIFYNPIQSSGIDMMLKQYGQAFAYTTLSKSGLRPLIYSAIGSHANFAVPGTHSRNLSSILVNDTTSAGPLWDPVLSAYFYTYQNQPRSLFPFVPSSNSTPEMWLYYYGRWGDEQYPDSDPRQVNFFNLNVSWKYESGPTGPADKGIVRVDVCPDVQGTVCVTSTALPEVSGSSVPVTVVRTSTSPTVAASTTALSLATASVTSKSAAGGRQESDKSLVWMCLAGTIILMHA